MDFAAVDYHAVALTIEFQLGRGFEQHNKSSQNVPRKLSCSLDLVPEAQVLEDYLKTEKEKSMQISSKKKECWQHCITYQSSKSDANYANLQLKVHDAVT